MSVKLEALTDNLLRRMNPDDRKSLGKAGRTSDEAMAAFVARSEKELQDAIAKLLSLRGIWFDRDGMHKRRTGTIGAPDFQFPYRGKFVSWETKYGAGKLDATQERVRDAILKQGGEWRLITSLDEARAHLEELNLA